MGQFVPNGQKCQFVLPQGDMNAVEAAVLSARADLWFASFFPAAEGANCCDLFFYKVRLERQERFAYDGHVGTVAYSTALLSVTVPKFPSDLKLLFQLLYANPDSVRARYAPACR